MVNIVNYKFEDVMILKSGKIVKPSDRKLAKMVEEGALIPENRDFSTPLACKHYKLEDYTNCIHARIANLDKEHHPLIRLIRNIYQKIKNLLILPGRFVTDLTLLQEAKDKLNSLNVNPVEVKADLKPLAGEETDVDSPQEVKEKPDTIDQEPPLKQDVNPAEVKVNPIHPDERPISLAWVSQVDIHEGFQLKKIMEDPKKKEELQALALKWNEHHSSFKDKDIWIEKMEEVFQVEAGQLKPLFQLLAPFEDPIVKDKVAKFFQFIERFNPQAQEFGVMFGLKRPATIELIHMRNAWSKEDLSVLIALDAEGVNQLLQSTKSQGDGTFTAESIVQAIKALTNPQANELEDHRWPGGSLRWCL
jgi:hypothetical protein